MISIINSLKTILRGIAFLTIFLLSSCAVKSPLKPIDSSKGIHLSKLEHWQLSARVAITTPEDSLTASLKWSKNNDLFDFLISGAFGTTYAHLIQEKKLAILKIPDSDPLTHENAEQLLQQTLGWEFPLQALSYWIKGIPSGHPNEQIIYGKEGKIDTIRLNNWLIEFSKHKRFQGYLMPKMIKVYHPDMSMKLVAKKWVFFE